MNNKPFLKIEKIHKFDGSGPTKAFCDLLIMDTFKVRGLKIIEGQEDMFIGMPSDQGKDGKWYETFYPITKEARKDLQDLILEEYKNAV